MSYDNPNRMTYSFGLFDWGAAADEQFVVKGPKGKKGRLHDYGVFGTTEVFEGTTVTPKIAVGTSSDPDAYGDELDLNDVALNSAYSVRIAYSEQDTGFSTQMVDQQIPADTAVYVTCTGATGSPTGIGVPFVTIDWDN